MRIRKLQPQPCPRCLNHPILSYTDKLFQLTCQQCHLKTNRLKNRSAAIKEWNQINNPPKTPTQPPQPNPPPGSSILLCSTGHYTIVDTDMLDKLQKIKWHITEEGYIRNHKAGRLHHIVLPKKPGFLNDHINGIRWDNRRVNLRHATPSQNSINRNKSYSNPSGHLGVYWNRQTNTFVASVVKDGKSVFRKKFTTLQEAINARLAAEQIYLKDILRQPSQR